MRSTALILMLFPILALLSKEARADWQYLKWGMTVDQALAASKGKLRRCGVGQCEGNSLKEQPAMLIGDYSTGAFGFTVYALFDRATNKLSMISLSLLDPSKNFALVKELRSKYGETVSPVRPGILETYVWRDQKNEITAIVIGQSGTSVRYQPRQTASNRGL